MDFCMHKCTFANSIFGRMHIACICASCQILKRIPIFTAGFIYSQIVESLLLSLCNKVTSKCNRVTSKEQSELIKNEALFAICRHFLLTAFIEFEYSRPPVWPEDAAQSQQKKGIVRWGPACTGPDKTSRTEYNQQYFLSLPPLCWGGWDVFW